MRKDGKIKISYAVAAGVLLGSVSMTSLASPVAGVVGMASTDSATVASNSYSTLSGVSLTLANIFTDASAAAITPVMWQVMTQLQLSRHSSLNMPM